MLRRFLIIFSLLLLTACNDGDIITIDLEFEGNLARCEEFEDSYLLYDTREDPNEALILIIPKNATNELLFTTPTVADTPAELDIDETNTRFIFRSYNRAIVSDELCDVVQSGDLLITEDIEANSGAEVFITTTISDDDGDGLSNEQEGIAGLPDENGIYIDSQDSDFDGIPDYLDQDDDNDNVPTADELDIENLDEDDDPLTNPLNTDLELELLNEEEILPNYLDNDDDGDNIPTRLEDISLSQNPRNTENIIIDVDGIEVLRYLSNDASAMESFEDSGFITNTYTRTVFTSFSIENVGLEIINAEIIDFGTFENSFSVTSE